MNKNLPNINHQTVVFTKHAKERLSLRRFSEDMVLQVMKKPSNTYEVDDGKIKFIGKAQGAKVHALCKPLPEENKWLVISVWIRGEDDAGNFVSHRKYYGKKQDSLSKSIVFFLFILLFALIYYFDKLR